MTQVAARTGLSLSRHFTEEGRPPEFTWEARRSEIRDRNTGEILMEFPQVEVPSTWSQLATDILASKYFRKGGVPGTGTEVSARQVVGRLVMALDQAATKQKVFATPEDQGAFRDELTYLLTTQRFAFNSPAWFNLGLKEAYEINGDPAGNWAWTGEADKVALVDDSYSRPQVSACQPYHSLILTERGLLPIGQIVTEGLVGLRVADGDGWTDVKAVKANGVKLVHRIRLADGREIEATADHLVCAHKQRRKKTEEWVQVGDLKPGMYMRSYPRAESVTSDYAVAVAQPSDVDAQKAALAGWLQTDGYVGQPPSATSLIVELETINEEERAWVTHALDTVFPNVHRNVIDEETDDPKVDYKRIRLYGEDLRAFVEDYGLETRNPSQVVPQRVLQGTPIEQILYLRSVFQADGYVSLRDNGARVCVSKCSRKMMQGVQQILARLGIYARLKRYPEKRADR